MLWAAKCKDGQPGYALWHIFPATAAALLRKFLIEDCGFVGPGDPVHSQLLYPTPNLLRRLFDKYGILPYTVRQYPGDAVFIPAYCTHQVANLADAIKVASDFFSISNIQRTQYLVEEFRQQRLASSWGDDVLQFYLTLWYAWGSLSRLAKTFSQEATSSVSFHEDDLWAGSSVYPNSSTSIATVPFDDPSPSPMSVDPLPFSMASGSGEVDNYDVTPNSNDKHTNRLERRRLQAKNRKKARKEVYKFKDHESKPVKKWECPVPTCQRTFNRGGLFDHL